MTRVAVAMGANLGDRAAALQSALDLLAAVPGLTDLAVSPVYETDAVGGPADQPSFLNAVLVAETDLSAADLLARLHAIEASHGRLRELRWGPRTLDLDLLVHGSAVSADPALLLPHPRAHLRAFVLAPWADVDPTYELLGLGVISDLLAALPADDRAGARLRDDLVLSARQVDA